MRFKTIYAQNVYSFKEFQLDFDDYAGVTTIILGKNVDDKTANGAGKTSFLKTLYYAIFNDDLDGANLDEIQNRNSDNGVLVILTFTDKGHEYKITRYKNYKSKNNDFILHDGKPVNGSGVEFLIDGSPLFGDSPSKTQQIIEQKFKLSPKLFLTSVLTPQEAKKHFLTVPDTEKKELLGELLDLQMYAKGFDNVKKQITEINTLIASVESKIENYNDQLDNLKKEKNAFDDDIRKYELQKIEKIKNYNEEILKIKNELAELENHKPIFDNDLLIHSKKKLIEKKEIFANLESELSEESEIIKAEATEKNTIIQINKFLEEFEIKRSNKEKLLQQIQEEYNSLIKNDLTQESSNILKEKEENLIIIKGLNEKREKNNIFLKKELDTNLKISEYNNLVQLNLNKILEIEHSLQDLIDNNNCPTCLRVFDQLDPKSSSIKEELSLKVKKIKNENEILTDKILKLTEELQAINAVKKDNEELQKELEKASTLKEKIEQKIYEQKLFQEKIQNILKNLKQSKEEIALLDKEKEENYQKIARSEKVLLKINKFLSEFIPLKESKKNVEAELLELSNNIQRLELLHRDFILYNEKIQSKTIQINEIQKNIEKTQLELNPFEEAKKRNLKQINSLTEAINVQKKYLENYQDELRYLNFWKNGFAPTGIRSFITDGVIEILNKKTQDNLNELFNGTLSVIFDPESKNAKGVVSNTISTTFILNGKECSWKTISGGEKRRAILATNLAIAEIAENRSGTKFNIRFLDEVFDGMDEYGQTKCLSLFSKIAREKDGFFIISHEEKFQNLCQKALYIMKENEVSKIVSRQEFNSIDFNHENENQKDIFKNHYLSKIDDLT